MRIRERVLLIFLIGGATTALHQRGVFRGCDLPLHDAALAAASFLPGLLNPITTADERGRVIVVSPRDPDQGFTLDEVIDVVTRLGKRPNATCWLALPPHLALDDEKRVAKLVKALHLLGRVGLAWPAGDVRTKRAGLERIGSAAELPEAARFAPLPSAIENVIEFVTADRLEPNVDGRLRAIGLAARDGELLIPTPPVAIAASVLHESSLAVSRDALTLESFGGRDHPLAGENLLRTRPRAGSHPLLTLDEALALDVDKKDPPFLLMAFEGSPMLASLAIPWRPKRHAIQVIADTAEDLLHARSPRRPVWFTTLGVVTIGAACGAFAADRRLRFILLPLALVGCAILGVLGLALASGLPPFTAMLGATLLGFAVAGNGIRDADAARSSR